MFAEWDGKLRHPDTVTHEFKKAMKVAGLEKLRFHDIRHTHASILLRAGVHPKVVQERLGHANISTTLDIYSHVIPSMQKEAAVIFEQQLEPDNTKVDISRTLVASSSGGQE